MKYILLLLLLVGCDKELPEYLPHTLEESQKNCKILSKELNMEYEIKESHNIYNTQKVLEYACALSYNAEEAVWLYSEEVLGILKFLQIRHNLPLRLAFHKCCVKEGCYLDSLNVTTRMNAIFNCDKKTGFRWKR